jgi:hypothetical protein
MDARIHTHTHAPALKRTDARAHTFTLLHHLKIRFLKVVAKDARDLVLCLIPAIETIMDGHATTSHTTTSDTSAFDNIEVVVSALQVYPPLFLQNIKRSQVSNDSIHT